MLTSLRAILRGAARSLGVERAAYAALIDEMWPEIIGSEAAPYTRPAGLKGAVLFVEVESGLWAQELSAQRAKFAQEINRRLGGTAVEEIRFRQCTGVFRPRRPEPAAEMQPAAELTSEEMAAVDHAVEAIKDSEVREAASRAMQSQLRWRKRHNR